MKTFLLMLLCIIINASIVSGNIVLKIKKENPPTFCGSEGVYNLASSGIVNGKNAFEDSGIATIEWDNINSRWEIEVFGSLVAYNIENTTADPPCLSAGTWTLADTDCDVFDLSGDCDALECAIIITENTQSSCIDNGNDDYFSVTLNATAINGNGQFKVLLNGSQIGPNSNYGSAITIGDGTHGAIGTFSADGTSTYTLTVQDISDVNCSDTYTTIVVNSCTSGPMADYVIGREMGTVMTCNGIFADGGDLDSEYGNNMSETLTFCSDEQNHISFSFDNFDLESGNDSLFIYNGADINAIQIEGSPFTGTGSFNGPGTITSSSTCLTFRFISNSNINAKGWKADIHCSGSVITTAVTDQWDGYPYDDNCAQGSEIGGAVYEDINNDGDQDANEPDIKGVEVRIFDDNGQVGNPDFTDQNGEYNFTGLAIGKVYRIEFTVPSGMESGAVGNGSQSAIQFVESNNCNADLGLLDPGHFCDEANPYWVIPCYINGDVQHSSNIGQTGLARFLYNDSGSSPSSSYQNKLAIGKIGSTWGIAYKSSTNDVFISAMLKRHSGIGPAGIGAIYTHNLSDDSLTVSTLYDFGTAAGSVVAAAARFPGSGNSFGAEGPCGVCDNVDPTTFPQAAKVGFGDIDISADDSLLYAVNLFDRKVYQISTYNPAPNSATALPSQPWLDNAICNNGIARPWALKLRRGKLYVGVICDASTSGCATDAACADLTASLYAYDISTEVWKLEISFPLTYSRKAYKLGSQYWSRWIDDYTDMIARVNGITDAQFGQPIFADIEFDDDGSVIFGFGDRTGLQLGYQAPAPNQNSNETGDKLFSFGDILRASYNVQNGQYTMENNGTAGSRVSNNFHVNSGIGGKSFYWGDFWYNSSSNSGIGALAMLPGSGEVMFPVADAINPYSNGVVWMSNFNGRPNRKIEIYRGASNGNSSTFAKGSGVGDIQLICAGAPLEIGNHVWWDLDLDGLMDPNEVGLAGVKIKLYKDIDGNTKGNNAPNGDEILVASTSTDNYGRYIFSNNSNINGLKPEVWEPGHTEVLPNMVYIVQVNNFVQDSAILSFVNTFNFGTPKITNTQNQGIAGIRRDNNAYENGINAIASVTTTTAGANDHSIDFGFGSLSPCTGATAAPSANIPCFGDSLHLCANPSNGSQPYSFKWSGPLGFSSTDPKPSIPNTTASNSGTYMLTITDANSCADTLSILVEVNGITSSISKTDTDCATSSGAIDVTASGENPLTFDWAHIAGTDNDEDISGLDDGTYELTITDADGCENEHSVNIQNSNGPQITLEALSHEICSNGNGTINLTITNANLITWSQGPNTADISGLSAGTYTVVASDGVCTTEQTFTITNFVSPFLGATKIDASCEEDNGSISLTTSGESGPFVYNWSHISGNDDGKDVSGLADGSYTVTVTDSNDCTDTETITIGTTPKVVLITAKVDEACGGADGSINLSVSSGTSGFEYQWDNDGVLDNDDLEDLSSLTAGTYSVTVTDAEGCSAATSVTINNINSPSVTTAVTHTNDCVVHNGAIDLTPSGGAMPYTYDWDIDGADNPDDDTQNLSDLPHGFYTVTVTDANGCTVTTSAEVHNSDVALIKKLITNNKSIKIGDTINFEITFRNQGSLSVDTLVISDYIPSGFSFVNKTGTGDLNEGWDNNNPSVPFYSYNKLLNQGDQDVINIYLKVKKPSGLVANDYVNVAEISYSADTLGNAIDDCDSALNSNANDNGGSLPSTPADDEWLGDGSSISPDGIDSTDQDNVDPALVCIFDLALDNKLTSHSGLYNPGDTATFSICVYNQGFISTDSIVISYFIPIGYVYATSSNGLGWHYNAVSRKATKSITSGFPGADKLDNGEEVCMDIKLVVDRGNMENGDHITYAEIVKARIFKSKIVNDNGTFITMINKEMVMSDIDSDFDDDTSNDSGGCYNTDSDDALNGNGQGLPSSCDKSTDEDDQDPARVNLPFHSVGNQVWYDVDNDGKIDPLETTLKEVEVELYFINPNNGNCEMVAADTTDANGYYLFPNLFGGKYLVAVSADNFSSGGALNEYVSATGGTVQNLISGAYENKVSPVNADNDVDGDDNGLMHMAGKMINAVVSDTITLSDDEPKNESPSNDNITHDKRSNLTVDFGFIKKTFDLALRKDFKYPDSTYVFGEEIEFEISIYNQGNLDAKNIVITDYIPKTLTSTNTLSGNSGWDFVGDTLATYHYSSVLKAGDTTMISFFGIFQQGASVSDYINCAEIRKAEDTAGNKTDNGTLKDIDSTPDTLKYNDSGGAPMSAADGYVWGDGKGTIGGDDPETDEDDADPAVMGYVDMALKKEIISTGTVITGDTVRFRITVYNQGSIPLKNIKVNDYIPASMDFTAHASGWTLLNDSTAQNIITNALKAGDSISLDIVLQIMSNLDESNAVNYAEIKSFSFLDGADATPFDIDSKGDDNRTNDPGGLKKSPSDNAISGNGLKGGGSPGDAVASSDEDDHDPACVAFLDLALKKTLIGTGEPVMWGDTLKYALIIYNQGNEGVKNVKVVDYLPLGLSFLSSNAPEWSLLSNGHAIATLSNSLAAGASDTLYINLGVKQGVRSDDLINYAEISYFENTEGDEDKDFDSTPDDDDDNDGDINDDNTNNDEGDEDDHDIVKAPLFDLALRKTVASGHNVVVIGDEVVYKIEIFNQGTMDATAVEVADFHQNGLTFDITLNPDWKPKGNHLEYIPTVDIKAGESAAIYITLKVNNNANNANILNEAEIIAAKDALGVNRSDFDIDSKPDTDFTNDIGGLAGSDTDNVINDIGIVDEDDHDVAPLMMCGDIACKGSINISVDNSCSFTITPSMLLTDTSGFLPSQFNIDYFDLNGNRITDVRINERINVMISVPVCTTGNTECWTQVLIEDKLAPILDCAERDTILCFEMDSIRYPKTLDLCDNGVKVELVNQQFIKLCQNDTIVGMSRRTFRAIDAAGNVSDTCSTDVYIMTPKIRNIQFPDDTIVACSGSFNDLNTLQKAKFGGPIFMGFDLTTDTLGICLIRSDFEDRVLINTPCKKQVMRMWTVRQTFCTNKDTIIQMPQLITLVDTLAPIISVADTIKVVGSTNANCMVTFSLPGLTAKDACDTNVVINVFHDSIPVFYNGMTLRLPIDTHTLYVQAYDGCHNISNDTFVVILQDDTAPVTICLAQTTVSLNNNGIATIPALKFDDGSYDACSNVTFSVRRMTSTCDTASLISGSSVIFCCDDVGSEVMVELTATDASGHTSICMISVEIQDKDIPSITCPPNVTVDCNYIIGDLTVFGNVVEQGQQKTLKIDPNDVVTASGSLADGVFFGNCMDTVLESSTKSIDQCGLGTITRIFTARTMSGIEANCNQTITIIHDGNTNKPLITYPNNITIVNCDAAAAAPTFAGFPTADEGKCNRIGFGYKDQLVTPLDTTITCLKIIRTWTAHETCVTPNKLISTGKQTIYLEKNQGNNLLIEGTVISRYDEPVSKVAVALRSRKNQSINQSDTDNKGQYVFDNMPQGGNYKVIPYKNHDWSNGVSTLDLIQIQNHILGKTPIIDGYNMIAADVNNDANVSAIDLVLLRKIILGIDDEVKNNTSWRFVWQDNDISDRLDLSSSLIEQYELDALIIDMSIDWVGIKVGDISGNAAANGIEKSESRSNEHYQMNWQISNVNDNDQIDFYLPTLLNFNGIQGEINIPKGLNIHAFKGGQIILNGENIHIDRVRNRIAYSYSSLTPLEIKRDKPLFSLIISGAAKLDEKSLTMGENITKAEVYTNLKSRSYKLEKKGNNNQAFEVFQNEPNPWKKNTAIIVNVPNNGDATFNVYDVQGRLLINRKVTLTKGKNTIYLDKKEISVTGVLLYEVTYNDKVVTNKMIRME